MELHTGWHALVGEAVDYFAVLGVPEIYGLIVAGAKKPSSIILKTNVSHRFLMAQIGSQASSCCHHVPDFTGAIMR